MNVVQNMAKDFFQEVGIKSHGLEFEAIQKKLANKLSQIYNEQSKLEFLKYLISETNNDIKSHEQTCKKLNCGYTNNYSSWLFLVEQEVERTNKTLGFRPKSEDAFSIKEEIILDDKLDEIIEKLSSLCAGQQVIFEEMSELKEHFNLGKKNWLDLAIAKVIRLTSDKLLEEIVAKEIIKEFKNFVEDTNLLLNQ